MSDTIQAGCPSASCRSRENFRPPFRAVSPPRSSKFQGTSAAEWIDARATGDKALPSAPSARPGSLTALGRSLNGSWVTGAGSGLGVSGLGGTLATALVLAGPGGDSPGEGAGSLGGSGLGASGLGGSGLGVLSAGAAGFTGFAASVFAGGGRAPPSSSAERLVLPVSRAGS